MEIANNIKENQMTIKIVSSYQGTNWVVLHQQFKRTQNLIYAQIP
jgi:Mor family transcriptional regulator